MSKTYHLSSPTNEKPHHVTVEFKEQVSEQLWQIITDHAHRFAHGGLCPYCARSFIEREAVPHSRMELFGVDQFTGRHYDGTDIVCADCAREPYKITERVRVYISDRDKVILLHCQEVQSPLDLDYIRYDQRLN